MAKKFGRSYRRFISNVIISDIEREEKKKNLPQEKEKKMGPKMYLKALLIDKNYPEEETKKALINEYNGLKDDDEIYEIWIREIEAEVIKNRSKEVLNER